MIKTTAILLALAIVCFGDSSFVVEVYRKYLFLFMKHLCNGALIDPQWVLVPANCVSSWSLFGSYVVAVGSGIFQPEIIIRHEDFNILVHDIALIRLRTKATFQETGARACKIPPAFVVYSGDVTLYTRNKSNIVSSVVRINILPDCSHAGKLWEGHICAGDDKSVAVKGHEGSPITVSDSGQGETLVGLLSYARSKPAPAVYTRVSVYSNWIFVKQVVGSL